MFERIKKYKKLKEYCLYIVPLIGNMEVRKEVDDGFLVKANMNELFHIMLAENGIHVHYIDDLWIRKINVKQHSEKTVVVSEVTKERCKEGCLFEKKKYHYRVEKREEPILLSLDRMTLVFDRPVTFEEAEDEENEMKLLEKANMVTKLAIYANGKVLLNGNDISPLYRNVRKRHFVQKVDDLFHGIISKESYGELYNIHLGTLPRDCFQYKDLLGLSLEEEKYITHHEDLTRQFDSESFYDFLLLIEAIEGVFTEEDKKQLIKG